MNTSITTLREYDFMDATVPSVEDQDLVRLLISSLAKYAIGDFVWMSSPEMHTGD